MKTHAAREIIDFRRTLHRHPELSGRESGTAGRIIERLQRTRPVRIVDGLGEMRTGVCAVFDSGSPGPTLLLRCELDALPIRETNTFAHCSSVPGIAHQCGHDGHMATLVAVADGLHDAPIRRGRVLLLFQPAEETGAGARAVLGDGRFQALGPPDFVYAFHNVPKQPLGQVLVREGPVAQGSVGFVARFRGRTAHASYPEHGVNPSRAVTGLVTAVNGLHDRLAGRFAQPVLGTVTGARIGVLDRGPNFGVAPGEGMVAGVVRAHENADLDLLRQEIGRLAGALAEEEGLRHELSWHEAFAATSARAECVAVVERAARTCGLAVGRLDQPFRWSEDFGYFTSVYPGAFFGLGAGTEHAQLHDDAYDYPDELIAIGAGLYRAIVDQHLSD